MLTAWRLITARFADFAFSGEGARLFGGRWNRKGTPMVYSAGSQSLAMLEMLVQDEPLRARYVMLSATLPKNLKIESVTPAQLPTDWRDPQARDQLQAIGAEWVKRGSSAVLAVPCVVIPNEINFLLNPRHPSMARIAIGKPQEFITDLRLRRDYRSLTKT